MLHLPNHATSRFFHSQSKWIHVYCQFAKAVKFCDNEEMTKRGRFFRRMCIDGGLLNFARDSVVASSSGDHLQRR